MTDEVPSTDDPLVLTSAHRAVHRVLSRRGEVGDDALIEVAHEAVDEVDDADLLDPGQRADAARIVEVALPRATDRYATLDAIEQAIEGGDA